MICLACKKKGVLSYNNPLMNHHILVPEGDQCEGNPCGVNSGCRVVGGQVRCFCLPGYEGDPPYSPCVLPSTSCDPSPCGPNTRCSVLSNGFAKCTCLPGYIESPNTIRGCVPKADQCESNPCGVGAACNSTRVPPCYCPDLMIGNPYKSCGGIIVIIENRMI